jgi:AbrB family looped-hinge helix DNA binding protein
VLPLQNFDSKTILYIISKKYFLTSYFMETAIMPEVTIRPKGQVTIPAEIMKSWHLRANDRVNIALVNGIVTITPLKRKQVSKSLMSFTGVGRGIWGDTPEKVEATINENRNSWNR